MFSVQRTSNVTNHKYASRVPLSCPRPGCGHRLVKRAFGWRKCSVRVWRRLCLSAWRSCPSPGMMSRATGACMQWSAASPGTSSHAMEEHLHPPPCRSVWRSTSTWLWIKVLKFKVLQLIHLFVFISLYIVFVCVSTQFTKTFNSFSCSQTSWCGKATYVTLKQKSKPIERRKAKMLHTKSMPRVEIFELRWKICVMPLVSLIHLLFPWGERRNTQHKWPCGQTRKFALFLVLTQHKLINEPFLTLTLLFPCSPSCAWRRGPVLGRAVSRCW